MYNPGTVRAVGALVGPGALVGALGPPPGPLWPHLGNCRPGPRGPPGLLWAPLGPSGPGPCGPPWALMGPALMGPSQGPPRPPQGSYAPWGKGVSIPP